MSKRAVISEGRFYPVDHAAKVIVMLSWRTRHQAEKWARGEGKDIDGGAYEVLRGVKLSGLKFREYRREIVELAQR